MHVNVSYAIPAPTEGPPAAAGGGGNPANVSLPGEKHASLHILYWPM